MMRMMHLYLVKQPALAAMADRLMSAMHLSFDLTPSLLLIHLVPAVDRTTQNNIFNIAGALYAATLFLGVSNSSSVQVT